MNYFETLEDRVLFTSVIAHSAKSDLTPSADMVTSSPAVSSAVAAVTSPTSLSDSVTGIASDGKLSVPFRFFLPVGVPSSPKVPLIVYLHTLGDGGTDNVTQTYWMSNLRANTTSGQNAAYILAMQLSAGVSWYEAGKQASEAERLQMSLIRQVLLHQASIDSSRIYITGASAGALGVWDLLERNPKFFAAGVPMSGALGSDIAAYLTKTAIWAFHGAADTGVSPLYTRELINAIIRKGGTPWYTEVPDGGHFIWDGVYSMASLYTWMFKQRLASRFK